jgi:putative GTP pyrophosphokinase
MDTSDRLIAEYDQQTETYRAFTAKLRALIDDLLSARDIRVHSITCRTKTRQSLIRKLAQPRRAYDTVRDVTDIVGVRVVTYFADDVDRVAAMISDEFVIDAEKSADKRDALAADRFGYLSLHYIVSLHPGRADLTEYRDYAGMKAELQIRSILQHAWAEIEHDLGYKAESEVPRRVRRYFSRVAGLLELADDEFVRIRDILSDHVRAVDESITAAPEDVEIHKLSLESFITKEIVVSEIDGAIAELTGGRVDDLGERTLEQFVVGLRYLHIATIADLKSALEVHRPDIIALARAWLQPQSGNVQCGVSILYLQYCVLALTGDVAKAADFFQRVGIAASDDQSAALGDLLMSRWRAVTSLSVRSPTLV